MDNFNTSVKTIERDEAAVRDAFRTIDTEHALSRLQKDCQQVSSDSKAQGLAKKVFDQVSSDNAKAHLPNLIIFDDRSKEIKVDPKATEKTTPTDSSSLPFENPRHQTIDQAVKSDAAAVAQGKTDTLREDLISAWKAGGTTGVEDFVNKVNERLKIDHSDVSIQVPAVARDPNFKYDYQHPVCHPRIVKNGEVTGDFRVF